MDLLHLILSLYLRLFQTGLPLSRNSADADVPRSTQPVALWVPLWGWISVVLRHAPQSRWLSWRVVAVERLCPPPERPRSLRSRPVSRSSDTTGPGDLRR